MASGRLSNAFFRLNVAQFCGALNDNIFKLLTVLYLIHTSGAETAATSSAIAAGLFVVPFLLFSAGAGILADKYSKRDVLVVCKLLELISMIGAVLSFYYHYETGLFIILFMIGTHSALFSPAKYGIVPELVDRDQLSSANSILVMATYLAVILGSAASPFLVDLTGSNYSLAQSVCVLVAAVGFVATLRVKRTPPAGSEKKISLLFARDIWRTMKSIRHDRYLTQAVCASAYFTMLGAYMQLNMIPYGIQYLGLDEQKSGYLFFIVALGIALGALLSGKLSGRNIEFGIVPLGALILTVSSVLLKFLMPSLWLIVPAVFAAGLGAGLFIVPIDSFIQYQAPQKQRGEILAASSFLSWTGVLMASGLVMLTAKMGWSAATGFLLMGSLTFLLAVFSFAVLPDFLLRFLLLLVMRFAYRIRVIGNEKLPTDGAAVLVCNHVSHLDALLLVATQQRRLRFLLPADIYKGWRWLQPFFNMMGCIQVDPKGPPKQLLRSLDMARAALDEGFMVCVFAEDSMTRTGNLREFRRGFEYIIKNSNYPVFPVYIGGAWGAITSYYHGQLVRKWTHILRYPVTVLFGDPLPSTAKPNDVRLAVMELSCAYYEDRKATRRPLGELLVHSARNNWNQCALTDSTGKRLTNGRLLAAVVALSEKMRELIQGQKKVGILLPSSAGGALANMAVTLLGKVTVNLNFTSSAESFQSSIRQCELEIIITSKTFMEKLQSLPMPKGLLYIEDLLESFSGLDKLMSLLKARFLPARFLAGIPGFKPDHIATIIFSSGSTSEPKGVMLSHHNIISNIEALRAVFNNAPADNVCAALPFFHSLGYTAALWYPVLSGFSATYHPNPLEGAVIAELVKENKSTILFATPTFLLIYLRKAQKEDFASLKYVIVGAEKLKDRIAASFEEKFGIRPLEGYGATELSPVATLSLPDIDVGGVKQAGWKEGSVGLPLPGVAMKVVDPDTGTLMPAGKPGLLLIKGPNVMVGYLNKPDLTAEVLKNGWYSTGDVARIDSDGFVVITDRLSRFSKIAGEMVPHLGIEEELHKKLGSSGQVLAITSVPDEKKGEKLVLLYIEEAGDDQKLAKVIDESEMPNLWKPGRDACFKVDALPVLGTGKLDLRSLKSIAKKFIEDAKTAK